MWTVRGFQGFERLELGRIADWQLAASAVITGNGKNWVESGH